MRIYNKEQYKELKDFIHSGKKVAKDMTFKDIKKVKPKKEKKVNTNVK